MSATTRLARLRAGIDRLDDLLLLGLALRRQLVLAVAEAKRATGAAGVDPGREAAILARGLRLARRLGLPPGLARAQLALAITDGRELQGLAPDQGQGDGPAAAGMLAPAMEARMNEDTQSGDPSASPSTSAFASLAPAPRLLRWFPPPRRWAPLLRAVPPSASARAMTAVLRRWLAEPLERGELAFLDGRRIGIEVTDLGLRWVLGLDEGRLQVDEGDPEATVRGSATDLLSLAGRLEDADTLFFQRRLEVTGDTELGLTARNLLDRLPWESVPLAARILLDRGARFARAARSAYQARGGQA